MVTSPRALLFDLDGVRRRVVIATCAIFACAVSCGPYHAPGPIIGGPDATIGCYRLTILPWSPRSPLTTEHAPRAPELIRLDRTRAVTPSWAAFGDRWGVLPGKWHLVRSDSLILQWDNGTFGVSMGFVSEGDSVRGHAIAWFEEESTFRFDTTGASAKSVRCPA
jgi:hypothetical protein